MKQRPQARQCQVTRMKHIKEQRLDLLYIDDEACQTTIMRHAKDQRDKKRRQWETENHVRKTYVRQLSTIVSDKGCLFG